MTVLEVLGWCAVAPLLLVCVSEWCRYDGLRILAVAQATLPWSAAPCVPVLIAAGATGRWWLAFAAVVVIGTCAYLATPPLLVRRFRRPAGAAAPPPAGAPYRPRAGASASA